MGGGRGENTGLHKIAQIDNTTFVEILGAKAIGNIS
jgi:hypothetical protein